jgi:hypothetical protein
VKKKIFLSKNNTNHKFEIGGLPGSAGMNGMPGLPGIKGYQGKLVVKE